MVRTDRLPQTAMPHPSLLLFVLLLLTPGPLAAQVDRQVLAEFDFETLPLGALPPELEVRSHGRPGAYHSFVGKDSTIGARRLVLMGQVADPTPDDVRWIAFSASTAELHGSWILVEAGLELRPQGEAEAQGWLYLGAFDLQGNELMQAPRVELQTLDQGVFRSHLWVPPSAHSVTVGVGLSGQGFLECTHLRVEAWREPDVPTSGPLNRSFALGDVEGLPWGWHASGEPTSGFEVALGEHVPDSSEPRVMNLAHHAWHSRSWGELRQPFDAAPLRGKLVEFGAYVQVPTPRPLRRDRFPLGLYLTADPRIEGPGLTSLKAHLGPVDEQGWRLVAARMVVPQWTETLDAVVHLTGQEAALMGGYFRVVGEGSTEWEDPRPLEGRALENVRACARLLGYIRHFHPSSEALAADWEAVAIDGLRRVEGASDAEELARSLREIFEPLAPTVRIYSGGAPPPAHPALIEREGGPRAVQWRHVGFADGPHFAYGSTWARRRLRGGELPVGFHDPAQPWHADLGAGVECLVPLALLCDDEQTLPRSPGGLPHSPLLVDGFLPSPRDRATRLASVALAWNVLQHFYPYFDEVECDWMGVLDASLARAALDEDELDFARTLRLLGAELADGHFRVEQPVHEHFNLIPLTLARAESRIVVEWVVEDATGIPRAPVPGDALVSIAGRPVEELLAEVSREVSAAHRAGVELRALSRLCHTSEDSVELEFEDLEGRVYATTLETFNFWERTERPERLEAMIELEPGIFYVDADRASREEFDRRLPELAEARAVLFDLRGYVNGLRNGFIGHFLDGPAPSPVWSTPSPRWPDRHAWSLEGSSWYQPALEPRLSARPIFLIGPGAQSAAETELQIAAHRRLGPFVGAPTSGTNGNVTRIHLPVGFTLTYTGLRTRNPDGSPFHGIGVLPTHPVERTRAGIADGRDEVLEAALELAR